MDEIAVKVEHISKTFYEQTGSRSFKEAFVNFGRKITGKKEKKLHRGDFTALKDIDFEIKKGEFLGIVGRNGCGKSTLLKIIAGVYSPTTGAVSVNGKLTPFIELGVGFNPELTGHDNVFLNGALLGFTHSQMEAMYDDIVDFAELHEFMDVKLKNYSSGMQVRLAFSVAIRAESDILLIDEVLAVGDEAFQQKCFDVFEKYKATKHTIVLVTHDMGTVRRFCDRAILISDGKIADQGDIIRVSNEYSNLNQVHVDSENVKKEEKAAEVEDKPKYLFAEILDSNYKPKKRFNPNDILRVRVGLKDVPDKIDSIGVTIVKNSGEHISGINSRVDKRIKFSKKSPEAYIDFNLKIKPGRYHLLVELFSKPGKALDSIIEGPSFIVSEDPKLTWSGLVELPHGWHIKGNK